MEKLRPPEQKEVGFTVHCNDCGRDLMGSRAAPEDVFHSIHKLANAHHFRYPEHTIVLTDYQAHTSSIL